MKSTKTRILIADDHSLMRVGIRSMLESEGTFRVVGECSNGEEAVKATQDLNPDVIIMDLMMPMMNGADATAAILEKKPDAKIIVSRPSARPPRCPRQSKPAPSERS